MARITIFSDRYITGLRATLLEEGHTISEVPVASDFATVVGTNPEVIIAPYINDSVEGTLADPVIIELHEAGYKLLVGYQFATNTMGITVDVRYIIGSSGRKLFARTPDPLFDDAGIIADNREYDIGGDRNCYDYNFTTSPYVFATTVAVQDYYGTIIVRQKGEVTSTGRTLDADIIYMGFIYGFDGTRATNDHAKNLLKASITRLLGGEFTVSGETRDKLGNLSSFVIRAYSSSNGNLLASGNSEPVTGVYSIDPREAGSTIMCVSDDPDVMSLVIDNADHTVPNNFDFSASTGVPTTPTFTSIVSGNVTKYGLPSESKVVAVSIGTPRVIGSTISDPVTGDYSIDVQPYTDYVAIYTLPEYGVIWQESLEVSEGQFIHPTIPNGNVYSCNDLGTLGTVEPDWSGDTVSSGNVLMTRVTLTKPLINAFIKPIVTPL